MRNMPIDRRLLTGSIRWIRNRLTDSTDNKGMLIEHVRVEPGYVVDENGSQQSGYNQWTIYWDDRRSTHMDDGSIPPFAVGDSIRVESGPINGFPQLMKIIWIWQDKDQEQGKIHHIRLLLR